MSPAKSSIPADSPSRYAALSVIQTQVRYRGYDYRGRLLLRSTDPNLYKNSFIRKFAVFLERLLTDWFVQAEELSKNRNLAHRPGRPDGEILS